MAESPVPPADDPAVVAVDDRGITLRGEQDVVLDVLFDGRRIWSFWSVRDTDAAAPDGQRSVAWPRPLSRFLDGSTRLTVRSHVAGDDLYDEERTFGSGAGRINVVNRRGIELSIDKSGRLQMTFDTRSAEQVTPLLDSVERVIDALGRAGVEAFPAYGTLLGAHRDGALIGHDSDADLGYVSRHTHPADVIRESFAIQRRLAGMGYEVVRYSGGGIKVMVEEEDGNTRGLDVFSGFFDGDGHLVLMGEIRTPFEPGWIFPLGTTTLEGRELPAPADPDRLLAATYGPGWRTPDPAFKFETPASTSKRLNDWFRGTSVNRAEWDRKYQRLRFRPPPRRPDLLAKIALRHEPGLALAVDVGTGRGTNARYFARRGVPTLGLDFSARAFELLRDDPDSARLPLEFGAMNLLETRHVLAYGARVGATSGRRMVLARHVVDALPRHGRENLWRFLQLALTGGGRAYLDFLVSPTEEDRWAARNLLRPVDPDEVAAAVTARGGRVTTRRLIGSDRMGLPQKRRDTFYGRRQACRMVVEWAG
jgi:hypothetical protein